MFGALFTSVIRIVLVLLFAGSIFINITMFTWQAGAEALSGAFSALSKTPAVVTGLSRANSTLLASNQTLTTRIGKIKAVSNKVTKRVIRRTVLRVERLISSTIVKSIPYVGIAVIVALTAIELRDDCNTMRDIKELNAEMDTDITIDEGAVCGLTVPTVGEVVTKIKASPAAAYAAVDGWDLDVPSWSAAKAGVGTAWTGSKAGAKKLFKSLFGSKK